MSSVSQVPVYPQNFFKAVRVTQKFPRTVEGRLRSVNDSVVIRADNHQVRRGVVQAHRKIIYVVSVANLRTEKHADIKPANLATVAVFALQTFADFPIDFAVIRQAETFNQLCLRVGQGRKFQQIFERQLVEGRARFKAENVLHVRHAQREQFLRREDFANFLGDGAEFAVTNLPNVFVRRMIFAVEVDACQRRVKHFTADENFNHALFAAGESPAVQAQRQDILRVDGNCDAAFEQRFVDFFGEQKIFRQGGTSSAQERINYGDGNSERRDCGNLSVVR